MTEKRETRETIQEDSRPQRIPVGEARDVLSVKGQDPDRKYRWVNDENDGERLAMFEQAGYRYETDSKNLRIGTRKVSDTKGQGSKINKFVGKDKEGNKIFAYLMSIDKAWFEEDKALKAAKIDELEEGMEVPDNVDYGNIKINDGVRTVTINK